MSFLYKAGDTNVWNPASEVGILYLGLVGAAAQTFGMESGLEDLHCDTALIHVEPFKALVSWLVDHHVASGHPVLRLALLPVILPGMVMLERAGHPIGAARPDRLPLVEQAGHLAASMANL